MNKVLRITAIAAVLSLGVASPVFAAGLPGLGDLGLGSLLGDVTKLLGDGIGAITGLLGGLLGSLPGLPGLPGL